MTVIAWRSPCLVSDGRVTEDNLIWSNNAQKIFELNNGGLLGVAGDADSRDIVDLFNRLKGRIPSRKQVFALNCDFTSIYISPEGQPWLVECSLQTTKGNEDKGSQVNVLEINDPFMAVGSGTKWAMGAMAQGASALKAVKIACQFDNNCGGDPQIYKIEEVQ